VALNSPPRFDSLAHAFQEKCVRPPVTSQENMAHMKTDDTDHHLIVRFKEGDAKKKGLILRIWAL
jgi:hypothetical protein